MRRALIEFIRSIQERSDSDSPLRESLLKDGLGLPTITLFRHDLERFNADLKTLIAFAALITGKSHKTVCLMDMLDERVWRPICAECQAQIQEEIRAKHDDE